MPDRMRSSSQGRRGRKSISMRQRFRRRSAAGLSSSSANQESPACPCSTSSSIRLRSRGTIVCGVEPTSLFGIGERNRERTGEPRLLLPSERWDVRLASRARFFLEERVVILGRDPRAYIGRLAGRAAWPPPSRRARTIDRVSRLTFGTGPLDTASADKRFSGLFETGGGRSTTPEEFSATIDYLNALVRRFTARGGRVVWVELPRSGRTRAVEDRRYPRVQYWDTFAARIEPAGSAFTVNDLPALAAFTCPDGSHLDAAAAIPFTQELAAALAPRILPLKKPGT